MVRCVGKVGKKQSRFLIGVIFTQISWYCAANFGLHFSVSIEYAVYAKRPSAQSIITMNLLLVTLPMQSRSSNRTHRLFNPTFCCSNILHPARGHNLCIKDAHTHTDEPRHVLLFYLYYFYSFHPKNEEKWDERRNKIYILLCTQCTAVVVHNIVDIWSAVCFDCSSRSIVKVTVTCARRAACLYHLETNPCAEQAHKQIRRADVKPLILEYI